MLKKLLIIIMLIVLLLSASACKRPDTSADSTGNSNESLSSNNTDSSENTESSPDDSWDASLTLFRFLEDTNSSGQITPIEEQEAPGALPEMWRIPQPDQSRIGETVSIVLAKWHKAIPFYYSCAEDGAERLAVFLAADKIPMLMVFETQLGGVAELCEKISAGTAFQAKILAMVNISYEEGNHYAGNVCISEYQVAPEEFIADGTTLTAGECLGIAGKDNNTTYLLIKGGVGESASQGLRSNIDWMKQKFARFGVDDIMS